MTTLILNKNAVKDLLKMAEVIRVVEEAFRAFGKGEANMPPKSYLVVEQGDFRAMPASVSGAVGIKWVNVHPENPSRGLPTVMAVLIYNDPATGYPLAIMDATDITAYRTGASSAIASKYLARSDSRTLGVIGAGRQAYTQILAHLELFNFEQIRVFDRLRSASERLVSSFPDYPLKEAALEEAAASDIVCTQTPSRVPILKKEWILKGTHINAVGADAKGKEELEPSILKGAMVVVDDLRQARGAGEINVPISKGLFTTDEVYATLGEVVAGKKQGRRDRDAITIFDSTGLAITDITTARLIYEKARQVGAYTSIDLV